MLLLVALGGGLGAVMRFVIDSAIARRSQFAFPLGTFIINLTGSLLLGVIAGVLAATAGDSPAARVLPVLGTGFCGGYTTFSTASVEAARLLTGGHRGTSAAYALGTLCACVPAAAAGMWLGYLAGPEG